MCGIVGVYTKRFFSDKLENALALLRHRGPDDNGRQIYQFNESYLAIAQTRLSIIDLSEKGHQPMISHDKSKVIVFNGEIYNYQELRSELHSKGRIFTSNTDTEVLLHAWDEWGADSIDRFVGMFSFAIFDITSKKLTLVRDAFGIKPLFYYLSEDEIMFASELPALLCLLQKGQQLNYHQILNYLLWNKYDNSSETFYENIHQLEPGHLLSIDIETYSKAHYFPKSIRWWQPSIRVNTNITFEDAAYHLRELFLKTLRLHMRSDVPLAAALSGGLDSSAIVCGMRYLEPELELHTFSYIPNEKNVSEEKWIDLVNSHVHAIPHKVFIGCNDLSNDLDDLVRCQGEPFMSTSIYAQYRVFKEASKFGIKVMLDGQGADELLAGYDGYPRSRLLSLFSDFKFLASIKFIRNWSKWPNRSAVKAILLYFDALLPNKLKKFLYSSYHPGVKSEWIDFELT